MTSVATKTLKRKSACALRYGFVGARSLTGERVSGHPVKLDDEWAGIKVDVFLAPRETEKRTFIAITPCDSVYKYRVRKEVTEQLFKVNQPNISLPVVVDRFPPLYNLGGDVMKLSYRTSLSLV